MTEQEITAFLNRVVDGQAIRVILASGRSFDGILNGEDTTLAAGLHFDTLDSDRALRADWENVDTVDFRNARAVAGKMMVPPEHPMSGRHPAQLRADGVPLKPHTARNR